MHGVILFMIAFIAAVVIAPLLPIIKEPDSVKNVIINIATIAFILTLLATAVPIYMSGYYGVNNSVALLGERTTSTLIGNSISKETIATISSIVVYEGKKTNTASLQYSYFTVGGVTHPIITSTSGHLVIQPARDTITVGNYTFTWATRATRPGNDVVLFAIGLILLEWGLVFAMMHFEPDYM